MTREKIRFSLPSVDDLFTTQEMRDEAKLKKIEEIPISEIDQFPDHPFKVREDDDMRLLIDSIREQGIITPTVVRQKSDGRYEMLSGHRRLRACELLGYEVIRAEVVDIDRDAATILMVDSNLQRTEILPSERAFSYKMKLNAMKRQGRRTDLTSATSLQKLRGSVSRNELAKELGISHEQVRKYIRLTY
ncbi:MAG: ParB/RepB/Spo0J family partition protein [Eubacterium sp.]|nr:ParB/RepB/Spo0J family partition protein [Candidatus Colimonas fimequi]